MSALALAAFAAQDAVAQSRGSATAGRGGPLPGGYQSEAIDLNEGKSAAELFQAGCAVCHHSAGSLAKGRSPNELVGFLRQHYTSSIQHAQALSAFLSSAGPGRGGPATATPSRQAPIDRPPAAVGNRRPPVEDDDDQPPSLFRRKPPEAPRPQEAARPEPGRPEGPRASEREAPAKRKPVERPGTARSAPPAPATPAHTPATPAHATETVAPASEPAATPAEPAAAAAPATAAPSQPSPPAAEEKPAGPEIPL